MSYPGHEGNRACALFQCTGATRDHPYAQTCEILFIDERADASRNSSTSKLGRKAEGRAEKTGVITHSGPWLSANRQNALQEPARFAPLYLDDWEWLTLRRAKPMMKRSLALGASPF